MEVGMGMVLVMGTKIQSQAGDGDGDGDGIWRIWTQISILDLSHSFAMTWSPNRAIAITIAIANAIAKYRSAQSASPPEEVGHRIPDHGTSLIF